MVDQRLTILLKYLTNGETNTNRLLKLMSITEHQLNYSLSKLNEILSESDKSKITYENEKTIDVPVETNEYFKTGEIFNKISECDYNLSMSERLDFIYIQLFISSDYLPLISIMNNLQISRTTALDDIKNLRDNLKKNGINIKYTRTNGYELKGDEIEIRNWFLSIIINHNALGSIQYFIDKIRKLAIIEITSEKEISNDIFDEISYKMSFADQEIFRITLPFMINRFLKYDIYVSGSVKNVVENDEVFKLLSKVCKNKNIEIGDNLHYFTSWVISLNELLPIVEYENDIKIIMEEVINKFLIISGTSISNLNHFKAQLYLHFRPLFYRLNFKIPIFNPMTDVIKEKYYYIYSLVDRSVSESFEELGFDFTDSEVAYLTLHFASIYLLNSNERQLHANHFAIIYCPNGLGTSIILKNELENLLPDWKFEIFSDLNKLEKKSKSIELIFTTTALPLKEIKERPIIILPPILTTRDKSIILKKVSKVIGGSGNKSITEVMKIIDKYVSKSVLDKIEEEISDVFITNEKNREEELPMLSEIIKPELIQLNVEASDWRDAIRKSAQPLLQYGYIEDRYIDAMIEVAEDNGPYIVITENLALPHARTEDGVNKLGISVTTLKNPVEFGSKTNDPVKYVFCLAAIDNHTHLRAMGDLADILVYESFYSTLDKCLTVEEIYEYILNFEKRGENDEESINSL